MIITRIGAHVNGQPRNGYGKIDRHLAATVSFEAGAFDDMADAAIKIWRTQSIDGHEDAPGDIDRLTEENAYKAAFYWGPQLWALFRPIYERYQNVYLKPCNETGGSNVKTLRNLAAYFRGLVDYFTPLGVKLALWGCAGGDPDWSVWIDYIAPSLRYAYQKGVGHIYTRNAYGGVPQGEPLSLTDASGSPQTDNSMRPFLECRWMIENRLYMPMVIGEAGQNGGVKSIESVGVAEIVRDHVAYDAYLQRPEHWLIVASCVWVYGLWNGSNGHNVQDINDDLALYLAQTTAYTLADVDARIAAISAETEPPQVGQQQMSIEQRKQAHGAMFDDYSKIAKVAANNGYIPDMSKGEKFARIGKQLHVTIPAFGHGVAVLVGHPIAQEGQTWQTDRVTIILPDGSEGNPAHPFYPSGTDPIPVDDSADSDRIINIVGALPTHPEKRYSRRALDRITDIAIHHSAGPGTATPAAIANFHVSTRDWPGIAYHFYITADGTIYQTNDLETISYHVGGADAAGKYINNYALGICLDGTFVSNPPPQVQTDAAIWLVAHLRGVLPSVGTVQGHKLFDNQATSCPGDTSAEWYQQIVNSAPIDSAEKPDPAPAQLAIPHSRFIIGQPGNAYRMRDSSGKEEDCRYTPIDNHGIAWAICNTSGRQLRLQDGKIQRGWDTTQSESKCYALYAHEGGPLFDDWLDDHQPLGVPFTSAPFVQHYSKPNGLKTNSGTVVSSRTWIDEVENYDVLDDSGEIRETFDRVRIYTWTGGERYIYALGVGLVEFEARGVRHWFHEWIDNPSNELVIYPWMGGA